LTFIGLTTAKYLAIRSSSSVAPRLASSVSVNDWSSYRSLNLAYSASLSAADALPLAVDDAVCSSTSLFFSSSSIGSEDYSAEGCA